MPKVVNSRLIDAVAVKTNIYMPIIEAIANSIDAIEERGAKDGEIRVELQRNPQLIKTGEDGIPPISSIVITDNGIGFTEDNTNSFDELFSEKKISIGGKGFGRFTYLKYFSSTTVNSNYREGDIWKNRTFTFYADRNEFITDENITDATEKKYSTSVTLSNIKTKHQNKLNLRLDTIARKLFEVLLPYFVNDSYIPPKIVIVDPDERDEIILNDYLKDSDKIQLLHNETVTITGADQNDEEFQVKIFKIFHSQSNNRVALTAHHREVLSTSMHEYDPEFISGFTEKKDSDEEDSASGNYVIKAYVIGEYLDKYVSTERGTFYFQDDDETVMYPISKKHIERDITKLAASHFKDHLEPLKNKKIERIQAVVDQNMPWNRSLVKDCQAPSLVNNLSRSMRRGLSVLA